MTAFRFAIALLLVVIGVLVTAVDSWILPDKTDSIEAFTFSIGMRQLDNADEVPALPALKVNFFGNPGFGKPYELSMNLQVDNEPINVGYEVVAVLPSSVAVEPFDPCPLPVTEHFGDYTVLYMETKECQVGFVHSVNLRLQQPLGAYVGIGVRAYRMTYMPLRQLPSEVTSNIDPAYMEANSDYIVSMYTRSSRYSFTAAIPGDIKVASGGSSYWQTALNSNVGLYYVELSERRVRTLVGILTNLFLAGIGFFLGSLDLKGRRYANTRPAHHSGSPTEWR